MREKIGKFTRKKEECKNLSKYSSNYEDMIFYYSSLIKNEREDREIYKKKRRM